MNFSEFLQAAASPENLSDDQLGVALDMLADDGEAFGTAALAVTAEVRRRRDNPSSAPAPTAPVAASGRAAAMAAASGKPAQPSRGSSTDLVPIVATGAGRGGVGGEVLDSERFAKIVSDTLGSMRRTDAPRGETILARADWRDRYPAERTLGNDAFANGNKLAKIVSARDVPAAIAASGGICSPVDVDWSIPVFAAADTPLADGLPSFLANRGGLTFTPPPDIGNLAAATEVWTAAMDAGAPGNGLTKPVLSVACGSPTTVLVDAVPTRLGFGNMEGRFAPEWIEAQTLLSVAAASRIRELNLLSHIDAASTLCNSFNLLGTSRDLLATVDQVVAYYKDLHRLPDDVTLTAIFPRWARDAMRADLVREVAHDVGAIDVHAISDAEIDGWLDVRGVKAIWMMDGRPVKTTGASAYQFPVQTYSKVTGSSPIPPWITKLVWSLFVEGTFTRLDSGTMDVGVVRDSTLDATNDYELFSEVFEGIAFRGVEALEIISPLLPNGASAGTIATSTYTGA